MENRLKIGMVAIGFCFLAVQSACAEITMNDQTAIINQLKAQAIEPNKTYFQHDFSNFDSKKIVFQRKVLKNQSSTENIRY